MRNRFLFILLSFFAFVNAEEFLIVEDPSGLIIYDKFESAIDLKGEYIPFQVVDKDWALGDGVSTAYKVILSGADYFILKDDNGNLNGFSNAGKIKKYSAIALSDTVTKKSGAKVSIGQFPGKRKSSDFSSSAIVVFKYKSYYYLKSKSNRSVFGWSEATRWSKQKSIAVDNNDVKIDGYILEQITSLIDNVNKKYSELFSYYNEKTNDSRRVPSWSLTRNGDELLCTLKGTHAYITQLEESSRQVVQSIMTVVQGEPFDVNYDAGVISVVPAGELK